MTYKNKGKKKEKENTKIILAYNQKEDLILSPSPSMYQLCDPWFPPL